jgi:WXG100 family type VII secretion target
MATIRVNTDTMRQLADCFHNINDNLEDNSIPQIKNSISQLDSDWQGASRARYEHLFHEWIHHAYKLSELGEEIARHLRHTADAFDNADQS